MIFFRFNLLLISLQYYVYINYLVYQKTLMRFILFSADGLSNVCMDTY